MFNLYIQYCPNEADAYECRGLLYYTAGDYEKAKIDYEKALSILPNLENAKYMLKKINAKLSES
jgi:tetratricopeptide (TPR) repeat protein